MADGYTQLGRARSGASGGAYTNIGHDRRGAGAPAPGPKTKERGLLNRFVDDLRDVAVQTPAGLYHTAGAVAKDVRGLATGKNVTLPGTRGIAKETAVGIARDLRHPLRHPGLTALDLLAIGSVGAGSVARGAAVAGRLGEGASASQALRAGVHLRPGPRVLREPRSGLQANVPAARGTVARVTTRQIDKLRERYPDAHIGLHDQPTRVGRALEKNRQHEYRLHTTPFVQLKVAGRKIKWNSPRGRALRMVAEGTRFQNVLDTNVEALLNTTSKVERKALIREIRLAREARQYVNETPEGLSLSDPKLQALFDQTKAAADLEDARLIERGAMTGEGAATAVQAPGRIYQGAEYGGKDVGLLGAEDFDQGQFHVGQVKHEGRFSRKPPAVGRERGAAIGKPKPPPRLTHALTGASIKKGGLRHDVPKLVAEKALESEKHAALLRAVDDFAAVAQVTPAGLKRPVPIRLDELKGNVLPDEVKLVQEAYRAGETLAENDTHMLGYAYETLRDRVFPRAEDIFPQVDLADIAPQEGIAWIDERLLGGLNKRRPLEAVEDYRAGRATLGFADAVNDAVKTSLLYLKPAYALPNMFGNTFLNVTQQGFAAPLNLGRAAILSRRVGAENAKLMDNYMGEGLTGALEGAGRNPFAIAAHAGSTVWSKLVDVPFRRAAFIHEARRLGHKTPAQIKALLNDAKHSDDLAETQTRATRAIIDYGDLTPIEQDVIRRVLFFYPWLKGSTRYAGEYLREHPIQAAFITQLAKDAKARQEQELGEVPPYGEGLFKVGERDGLPMVSNPTSAGILGQPADLAAILQAFLSGDVPRGREIEQLLTPVLGAGLVSGTGYETFSGREKDPSARTFAEQLVAGQPLKLLYERLTQDQSQRTFPLNTRDALLQFLAGTPAPRPVNLSKLNAQAKKAYEPRGK